MTASTEVKKQVKVAKDTNQQLIELTAVRKAKHLDLTGKVKFSPNKQSVVADLIAKAHKKEVSNNG